MSTENTVEGPTSTDADKKASTSNHLVLKSSGVDDDGAIDKIPTVPLCNEASNDRADKVSLGESKNGDIIAKGRVP